jgi:hypothetical protein
VKDKQVVDQNCDIILQLQDGGLQRISHIHPLYSPLHYTLLFPHGDQGWHTNIPIHNVANKKVTQHCYYTYHLFLQITGPDIIFQSGQLF